MKKLLYVYGCVCMDKRMFARSARPVSGTWRKGATPSPPLSTPLQSSATKPHHHHRRPRRSGPHPHLLPASYVCPVWSAHLPNCDKSHPGSLTRRGVLSVRRYRGVFPCGGHVTVTRTATATCHLRPAAIGTTTPTARHSQTETETRLGSSHV
jgi:hypothetical protein